MEKTEQSYEVKFDEEDIQRAAKYFKGYTGVDINDIPAKFEDYIMPVMDLMLSQAKIVIKYCGVDIIEESDTGLLLENDIIFEGEQIKKAYSGVKHLFVYVTSVINIDDILKAHPDMMETFFIEYWATSMLNASREKLTRKLNGILNEEGCKCTSVWSPGQNKFELINQKPLFDILKPETIGVTLDKHMRMIPLKTVSGTMGVIPVAAHEKMISCDYCEHRKYCPGYAGKKIKNQEAQRRLI